MKFSIIVIVFFSFFCLNGNSQVTIGVDEDPAYGAILQLKDQKNVAVGGANATKGLLLPRVHLTDLNSLADINPDSEDRPEPSVHVGLTVYNMNEDVCNFKMPLKRGVYIWNGQTWNLAGSVYDSKVEAYKDQNGNEFRASQFGTAGVWMIENLRATKYADNLGGSAIIESVSGQSNVKSAYTYPGLNKSNFDANPSMGLLYDWVAATNNKPLTLNNSDAVNGVEKSRHSEGIHLQGICPEGWHIPTAAEWIELEKEIISNASQYSSLSSLSEPIVGLDPTDPFSGRLATGSSLTNKRGDHAVAMTSICNLPGVTMSNLSKGNSYYDGGFSAMMSGQVWSFVANGTVNHSYGSYAYFFTGSLAYNDSSNPTTVRYVGFSLYPDEKENAEFSIRSVETNHNGGYLSVRCKKN